MRRLFAAATLALLALPLLVTTTLAGGWASAVLDDDDQAPTAGQTVTVGFTLLQHAKEPTSWPTASITFTKAGSSEKLTFAAKPAGKVGHYVAEIKLPSEGSWAMQVTTQELHVETVLKPLAVKAAPAAAAPAAPAAAAAAQPAANPVAQPAPVAPAAPATPASAPVQTGSTTNLILLAVALAIAGLLGAGLLVMRRSSNLGRREGSVPGR